MPVDRYQIDRDYAFWNYETNPWTYDFDQVSTPYGVMNLTRANSIPLLGTLPHFLDADPKLLDTVVGLHPDRAKHNTIVEVEPRTGLVTYAQQMLQLNGNIFNYELPGADHGLPPVVKKAFDDLFPELACDTSDVSWTFPKRRFNNTRQELGTMVPVGYLDRGYKMSKSTVKATQGQLDLAEIATDCCLVFFLLLSAFLFVFAYRRHKRAVAVEPASVQIRISESV